jgi:hypothetical protein
MGTDDFSPSSQSCSSANARQAVSVRSYRRYVGLFGAHSAICKQFSAFSRKISDCFIRLRYMASARLQYRYPHGRRAVRRHSIIAVFESSAAFQPCEKRCGRPKPDRPTRRSRQVPATLTARLPRWAQLVMQARVFAFARRFTHCPSRHPLQRRRSVSIDLGTESSAGIGTGHKTPCFGYADALVGWGSAFASWSEA